MSAPNGKLTLSQAFARQEGYYVSGSRSARNLNPGDIRWGSFARTHGATRGDTNDPKTAMAVFPTEQAGFAAFRALLTQQARYIAGKLSAGYLGASLEQVIYRYAPPSENDTEAYLHNVCSWMGLERSTVMTAAML